jgi:hypothetical protein
VYNKSNSSNAPKCGPITVAGQSLERAQNVYTTLQLENMNVKTKSQEEECIERHLKFLESVEMHLLLEEILSNLQEGIKLRKLIRRD